MKKTGLALGICGGEFVDMPLKEACETIKNYGVEFVELYLDFQVNLNNISEAEKALRQYKLEAACISSWSPLNESEGHKKLILESIDVASRLGASFVNTYFGVNNDRTIGEAVSAYVENISPCLEKAEQHNITILLENEFNIITPADKNKLILEPEVTGRVDGCIQLLESVNSPRFRMNFDPANFHAAGEKAFPYAYERLRQYIDYVHVKDIARYVPGAKAQDKRPNPKIWKDYFTGEYICPPVGEGEMDYYHFIGRLKKDGYSGFLMLEPHVELDFRKEAFQKSLDYIRRLL